MFWDNTCRNFCNSTLSTSDDADQKYCQYPCSSSEFLDDDGFCQSTCPTPYSSITYLEKQFCQNPCESSEYILEDSSCVEDCPSPMELQDSIFCQHPCDNTDDYYNINSTSCQSNCNYDDRSMDSESHNLKVCIIAISQTEQETIEDVLESQAVTGSVV